MNIAARGLFAGLLVGLLLALLLTATLEGLRLPGFEPTLLGPFRWEAVSPGLA
jgi:hypothetical protein